MSRTPIADHALLSDRHSSALVTLSGSVDWLAFPRFDSPSVSTELMQVYALSATPRLKRQIVTSLGDRADSASLLRIVRTEPEATVRDLAIVTLGRSGSREQLRTLYGQAPAVSRAAVLSALFSAKDDDELSALGKEALSSR